MYVLPYYNIVIVRGISIAVVRVTGYSFVFDSISRYY